MSTLKMKRTVWFRGAALTALFAFTACSLQDQPPGADSQVVPESQPLATVPASANTIANTAVVSWELRPAIVETMSVDGIEMRGVDAAGNKLVEVAFTRLPDGSLEIRPLTANPARLLIDAEGKVVDNTLSSAPEVAAFIPAFSGDFQSAAQLAQARGSTEFDCFGDWLNMIGACGAIVAVCFFSAGWACAVGLGLAAVACAAAIHQASDDRCFPQCDGRTHPANYRCPSGWSLRRFAGRTGGGYTCCR